MYGKVDDKALRARLYKARDWGISRKDGRPAFAILIKHEVVSDLRRKA